MTRENQGGFLLFLAQRLVWPALTLSVVFFGYSPFTAEALKNLAEDLPIAQFALAGVWTLSFFLEYVGAGFGLSLRRDWAILELIYVSPHPRMGWLLSVACARALGAYLVHLPFLLLAGALSGIPSTGLLWLATVAGFIACMSIPWGMFVCATFLLGRNSRFFYALFETPAEFFSGSRFPLQALPAGAALAGALYPLAQSTILFRQALSSPVLSARLASAAAFMAATSLLYAVAAWAAARQAERISLRNGDLSYS